MTRQTRSRETEGQLRETRRSGLTIADLLRMAGSLSLWQGADKAAEASTDAEGRLPEGGSVKKGEVYQGVVIRTDYPARGIVKVGETEVRVKDGLPGQEVRFRITKKQAGRKEAMLLGVLKRSDPEQEADCPHYGRCGGCCYRTLSYEDQLRLKEDQVLRLFLPVVRHAGEVFDAAQGKDGIGGPSEEQAATGHPSWFEGIKASPDQPAYRNKMEFTFGDMEKGGRMTLGLHARGSFYDILTVDHCRIVDEDYGKILTCVLDWAKETGLPHFHRVSHKGFFRHLLVRRAGQTGEILLDVVTTSRACACGRSGEQIKNSLAEDPGRMTETSSDKKTEGQAGDSPACDKEKVTEDSPERLDWEELVRRLLALPLKGKITGILHTTNDSVADAVKDGGTDLVWGENFITERLLGLTFRITPFSFFQTNSRGAEVLYDTVRSYLGSTKDKVVFDLYSGTGTIAQILAPSAKHVTGVEIVPEAVESARKSAAENGLDNCDFLCGDVLKVVDDLTEKPDLIVLDPPREGIHPKALPKIIDFGVDHIVYIACKATSLVRDLVPLQQAGYRVEKLCAVDLFPGTEHVETVCLLSKLKTKQHIEVELNLDELD